MTGHTCRLENCWSFFNFSFCFRDFNEVLFHKKYTKITDKSSKNGLSSEPFFLDFLNESLPRSFLHLKALEMSFSKLVLHAKKVHLIKELWLFKVCLGKRNFSVFIKILLKFSFFMHKLQTAITPLKMDFLGM